jgi:hypothetical protein
MPTLTDLKKELKRLRKTFKFLSKLRNVNRNRNRLRNLNDKISFIEDEIKKFDYIIYHEIRLFEFIPFRRDKEYIEILIKYKLILFQLDIEIRKEVIFKFEEMNYEIDSCVDQINCIYLDGPSLSVYEEICRSELEITDLEHIFFNFLSKQFPEDLETN